MINCFPSCVLSSTSCYDSDSDSDSDSDFVEFTSAESSKMKQTIVVAENVEEVAAEILVLHQFWAINMKLSNADSIVTLQALSC